ncbi:MAG: GxxExxY protein [Bacteroidetes bacterium]|jgi:GxxExxY protein|nr:GxxExxY protein [Bacteroidota bacterium]
MTEIIYKEESYKIIGACMKVHAALGAGFLESVYQEALEKQFIKDQIPYAREKILKVHFDGQELRKTFKADFVCYDQIIVELKSASFIHIDNIAQTKNYLKATQYKLGLLVNFGEKSLTYKRILNS